MKQFLKLSAPIIWLGFAIWLMATNTLVWLVYTTNWWPIKIVLFASLIFLPGLALLRATRMVPRVITAGVLYGFGLGLLVLMLSGLAANQLLYEWGVAKPLELGGILITWNVLTAVIVVVGMYTNRRAAFLPRWRTMPSKLSLTFIAAGTLLPCLAAMGAYRLNNGGDALLSMAALAICAVFVAALFVLRRHLPDGLIAWSIFIISLTILLMTSLRGWGIVGHDIEREFNVYTLTHMNARWDIALDRDPYNACLSITILPEVLATLLHTSGLIIFKVVLQVIFAVCPVVIYVLLRRYASTLGALTGSMLFICYPTFINDSAMLTRQGVAYIFFALAILMISSKAQGTRHKLVFLLCALGAILSHYSTAYMFVALFAIAVICKFLILWQQRRWHRQQSHPWHSIVSPLFAALVFLMTFVWYTQITATSGGLIVTIQTSLANIPKLFSDDNKSSDTATALFFAGSKTQADLYEEYIEKSQHGDFVMADTLKYLPALTSDDLPLTQLGKTAIGLGINPSVIITLRQSFAKVLQLLALAGVMYAMFRLLRKKPINLSLDFICLSMAGLLLLVLMVALPVLSINYGILRAFQQALIFLTIPITVLLAILTRPLWGWLKTLLATTATVLLFLLFTGIFAQLLGGVSPSLSMNNQGLYFGLYYTNAADKQSFAWLKQQVPKGNDVRAANFNRAHMYDPAYPFTRTGILPLQTKIESYVYLDHAQIQAQKIYTYFESSPLIMTFPVEYYDLSKSRIYSTQSTGVYR